MTTPTLAFIAMALTFLATGISWYQYKSFLKGAIVFIAVGIVAAGGVYILSHALWLPLK